MKALERPVCSAIGAYPGNMVTGKSPGILQNTGWADLKSAGASPAKLFPLTATVALKGSSGPSDSGVRLSHLNFRFRGKNLYIGAFLPGHDNQDLSRLKRFVFINLVPFGQVFSGNFVLFSNGSQIVAFFYLIFYFFL
jgi:hypothetical protein